MPGSIFSLFFLLLFDDILSCFDVLCFWLLDIRASALVLSYLEFASVGSQFGISICLCFGAF